MKKAPRSSAGHPVVAGDSDSDNSEEWSEESVESDTIASKVRDHKPNRNKTPYKDKKTERRRRERWKQERRRTRRSSMA